MKNDLLNGTDNTKVGALLKFLGAPGLVNAEPIAHNYKIATLTPNSNADADHLHMLVTLNNSWYATAHSYLDLVFVNRGGFSYQYTLRGAPVTSALTLAAYQNSDSSVDIYINMGASTYSVVSYTILENVEDTAYSSPAPIQTTPPGTLVFDASNPSYRPATYADNVGNFIVQGGLKLTSGSGASMTFADGTIQNTAWTGTLCGGDYAESLDVMGERSRYEPGDVLVVDPDNSARFLKSSQPYSTLVAGIYSTKPGLTGRRQTTDPKTTTTEVPMAMVGIVPTKVSAENGAIKRGDLLVTSSTPGYVMKGTDRSLLTGAIVGKAVEPFESGIGVIEVLVSLQ